MDDPAKLILLNLARRALWAKRALRASQHDPRFSDWRRGAEYEAWNSYQAAKAIYGGIMGERTIHVLEGDILPRRLITGDSFYVGGTDVEDWLVDHLSDGVQSGEAAMSAKITVEIFHKKGDGHSS